MNARIDRDELLTVRQVLDLLDWLEGLRDGVGRAA